jgi:hypothetical protein
VVVPVAFAVSGFSMPPLFSIPCRVERVQAVWRARIGVPNSWVRSSDVHAAGSSDMSPEHLTAPAAFEADDIIAVN